jgi:hypothetical protein
MAYRNQNIFFVVADSFPFPFPFPYQVHLLPYPLLPIRHREGVLRVVARKDRGVHLQGSRSHPISDLRRSLPSYMGPDIHHRQVYASHQGRPKGAHHDRLCSLR